MGKQWKQWQTLFWGAPKSLQMVTTAMKWKDACSLEENYDQHRQHIKKQRHYFINKDLYGQSYGFSSSCVWMSALDYKESWALKNWCFWTVVLEKTLESPLDCKEIQLVHPKGNQSWIFFGRTDAVIETLATWCKELTHWKRLTHWENWVTGKDWRQNEKGTTEGEMVGWHYWFNGQEFE